MQSEIKNCQNCQKDFTIEPDDFKFYEKMKVPPPTFCPKCRLIRRMIWRNERTLYKRKCDLCKKIIFSMYPVNCSFPVYCPHCWSSDQWNPMDYGKDCDFSKPFFEQFKEILEKIPLYSLFDFNNVNSFFGGNLTRDSKNLYLSYSTIYSEYVSYSKNIDYSKLILDSFDVSDSDTIYQGNFSKKNYECGFILDCRNCINSRFIYDCVNCHDCILSSNLRNKEFYIRNKKYSKEEYFTELEKINFGSYKEQEKLITEFSDLVKNSIHKYANVSSCTNCSGDDLFNSKNVKNCFDGYNLENTAFTMRTFGMKDVYDVSNSSKIELVYETQGGGMEGSSLIRFNIYGSAGGHNHDIQYTMSCGHSHDLFMCIGLRNKSYCILNKQYTKEEYEELVPKIIKQMNDMPYIDKKGRIYRYGEFFPSELSPFSYNETIAQEYFPLTKEEALKEGYKWKEKEERNYTIDIKNEDIPNNIKDVDDSIINKVIECANNSDARKGRSPDQNASGCTEAYKIIPDELSFYKRMNLPIPHLCPNCRHYNRLKQRNPLKLWSRECMCSNPNHRHEGGVNCTNEFETSYSPDRPEIIYCEQCYNKEVY